MIENEEREKEREREERREAGGKGRREGRVSSSCNAIDPVAVHHVDTILVRSFQTAGVVQVGFCAITSVAGPTCARMHARTHARAVSYAHAGCARERALLGKGQREDEGQGGSRVLYPGSALLRRCNADCAK
jgi:hypothetical protein